MHKNRLFIVRIERYHLLITCNAIAENRKVIFYPDSDMGHISLTGNFDKGPVVWLDRVTEAQFKKPHRNLDFLKA